MCSGPLISFRVTDFMEEAPHKEEVLLFRFLLLTYGERQQTDGRQGVPCLMYLISVSEYDMCVCRLMSELGKVIFGDNSPNSPASIGTGSTAWMTQGGVIPKIIIQYMCTHTHVYISIVLCANMHTH